MPRVKKISKIKGKGVYDKVVNKLVPKYNKLRGKKQDKNDHVLKDGEKHVIMKNKDGALVRAQFAGPQTDLVGNLKKLLDEANGDYDKALSKKNFVSDVDRIALLHDSRYALEGDNPEKVRRADEKMVAKIKDAEKAGESKFNTLPSKLGIQAKIKLSDIGLMKKDAFANNGSRDEMTDEEIEMVQKAIDWMEQKGYGKFRPLRQKGGADRPSAGKRSAFQAFDPLNSEQRQLLNNIRRWLRENHIEHTRLMNRARNRPMPVASRTDVNQLDDDFNVVANMSFAIMQDRFDQNIPITEALNYLWNIIISYESRFDDLADFVYGIPEPDTDTDTDYDEPRDYWQGRFIGGSKKNKKMTGDGFLNLFDFKEKYALNPEVVAEIERRQKGEGDIRRAALLDLERKWTITERDKLIENLQQEDIEDDTLEWWQWKLQELNADIDRLTDEIERAKSGTTIIKNLFGEGLADSLVNVGDNLVKGFFANVNKPIGDIMEGKGGVSKIIAPLKSISGKGLSSNKLKKTKKADLIKMLEQIDVMLD